LKAEAEAEAKSKGNAQGIPRWRGAVRSHWYIENKLHYTKDVIMREDKECTANKDAAAKLALLRNFAFNILKNSNKSIKHATEIFANYLKSASQKF